MNIYENYKTFETEFAGRKLVVETRKIRGARERIMPRTLRRHDHTRDGYGVGSAERRDRLLPARGRL